MDHSLALLREGYRFVSRRCERYGSDVFETRLLLQPAICLRGAEAARLFYDNERFIRRGALPWRVRRTLVGVGSVQGLDDVAHRDRKAMLMSMMSTASVTELGRLFGERWRARIADWAGAERVVLHDELARLLCEVVCQWAGVPVPAGELGPRTDDLQALIEAPAAVGPRYLRGQRARGRTERWIGGLIDQVRDGRLAAPEGSALRIIAGHRGPDGRPLDRHAAAVELLNILRPTVAIGRFLVFAALALHEQPRWARVIRDGDTDLEPFVQEVRRFYPFFPAAVARVRTPFEWRGIRFPRGRRVLLDLYGTDHDPALWPEPERFRPERFRDWSADPYTFIAQGGGDHFQHHRCAGEWITIALMKIGVVALTRWMSYTVPEQDLSVSLRRMPAIPASRFVITDVRPA